MLLAVDPSVRSPGAALFLDNRLIACDRIKVRTISEDISDGFRWLDVACSIRNWAKSLGAENMGVLTLVYERPQIYTWAKAKGDPNDLVGLAGVGSALAGLLACVPRFSVLTPKPDEWAGQVSKVCPVCKGKAKRECTTCLGSAFRTPRGQRIMSRLDAAERGLVPDQHDALDAVGIGLFACGRYAVQRVYSSGQ